MLKIKDDVDLEELKKFGFRNNGGDCWVKQIDNSDCEIFETEILINPLNAVIKNQIVHYTNNDNELEEKGTDSVDLTSELDTIYDLIQAGMVEKVERE